MTILALALYAVGAGMTIFSAVRGSFNATLAVGTISLGTVTGVWFVGYHFYVPVKVELVSGVIRFETRGGGVRDLPLSTYTLRLNLAGRFGSSLAYAAKTQPGRSRGIFLTFDQTQRLVSLCPELRACE